MKYQYKIALSFATEDQSLVEKVKNYLRAEGLSVFFAPDLECQSFLSGRNQREAFYNIFGLNSEYVALFVSKYYIMKEIPMEEANIALTKHGEDGKVIPVYLDGTPLPPHMLNPKETNYFKSNNPARIASHLAEKIKADSDMHRKKIISEVSGNTMNIEGNTAQKQVFIQSLEGNINL